jgi:hypothetical protein
MRDQNNVRCPLPRTILYPPICGKSLATRYGIRGVVGNRVTPD